MSPLGWILVSTFLMSVLSWVGLLFFAFRQDVLTRFLPFIVAFAAGSLFGGSFFHLMPEALGQNPEGLGPYLWLVLGFTLFLLMEQFLHWHHSHRMTDQDHENPKEPVTYLVLLADALHNFVGGLAIAASFLVSVRVGLITWLSAAAHEIPQEFGDFGILVHGGWNKRTALLVNFISALTIVPGGVLVYCLADTIEPTFLLPFAAGNFIYIAASDLIPEIKHSERLKHDLINSSYFVLGMAVILATRQLA